MPDLTALLQQLSEWQRPPAPFTPGEALFWDHPHISAQMLAAHLNPESDAASRRPAVIDETVDWLMSTLALAPGQAVLDLGCGPGLYAGRLARRGLRVTGVDYSRRSLDYAAEAARAEALPIRYRYENYLDLADEAAFDLALLIYGDFCPLAPAQRARLLANVRRALRPGGRFVLDVTTRALRRRIGSGNHWQWLERGFWRPGPHLLLEAGFDYPAESIWLDQVIVVEPAGAAAVYRMWFQDYTPEAITAELAQGGFRVLGLWGDLTGRPQAPECEWIGVVAGLA